MLSNKGIPSGIIQYIKDVQGLRPTDLINYEHLENLLKSVENKFKYGEDFKLDWVIINE